MMKTRSMLFGILMLTGAVQAGAGAPALTMNVTPAVAFAPATLRVRATIESDAHNRTVEISAESPNFYTSSEIQLDGDKAQRTTTFEFRSVPPGVYEVKAMLRGPGGEERGSARMEVQIMSAAGDRG